MAEMKLMNPRSEPADPPFLYEIRVKGQLSQERWTSWFDQLTVTAEKGETILRGSLPDRTAVYGLLARFRDLAVPLVAVNVLDAEAQHKLLEQNRKLDLRINLLMILVYSLLLGGLTAITVFLAPVIHAGLALAMLFAAIGGLAYAFGLWSGQKAWHYITYLAWPGSILTLFIFTAVVGLLHPALMLAALLFVCAGGLLYLIFHLRGRSSQIKNLLIVPDDQVNLFDSAGTDVSDNDLTPEEPR